MSGILFAGVNTGAVSVVSAEHTAPVTSENAQVPQTVQGAVFSSGDALMMRMGGNSTTEVVESFVWVKSKNGRELTRSAEAEAVDGSVQFDGQYLKQDDLQPVLPGSTAIVTDEFSGCAFFLVQLDGTVQVGHFNSISQLDTPEPGSQAAYKKLANTVTDSVVAEVREQGCCGTTIVNALMAQGLLSEAQVEALKDPQSASALIASAQAVIGDYILQNLPKIIGYDSPGKPLNGSSFPTPSTTATYHKTSLPAGEVLCPEPFMMKSWLLSVPTESPSYRQHTTAVIEIMNDDYVCHISSCWFKMRTGPHSGSAESQPDSIAPSSQPLQPLDIKQALTIYVCEQMPELKIP